MEKKPKYLWKITKDHLDGEDTNVIGPLHGNIDLLKYSGEEFQMFDGDDILYYTGMIYGDYSGFEPLDDFGTPNAGCTSIHIDGKPL